MSCKISQRVYCTVKILLSCIWLQEWPHLRSHCLKRSYFITNPHRSFKLIKVGGLRCPQLSQKCYNRHSHRHTPHYICTRACTFSAAHWRFAPLWSLSVGQGESRSPSWGSPCKRSSFKNVNIVCLLLMYPNVSSLIQELLSSISLYV